MMAFLFGLGWVAVFGFFSGTGPINTTENGLATDIEFARVVEQPAIPVSMDSEIFTPPSVDENNPNEFDPEGTYSTDADSDLDFSFVISNKNLEVACDEKGFGDLVKPSGFVYEGNLEKLTDGSAQFEFSTLQIEKDKIRFRTEEKNGVSYEFSGEFLVTGNFYTLDPDAKVLKGELVKKKNGETLESRTFVFNWSLDLDCVC